MFARSTESLPSIVFRVSAPLHDIDKVGIPDSILLKPGKLDSKEFEIMKRHTIIGHDTLHRAEKKLGGSSFLSTAREIACSHHEKWNGSGYPRGLSGDDIPLAGRLMALADVYDALVSRRSCKTAFPRTKAVAIILEDNGSHFDPCLVEIFEWRSRGGWPPASRLSLPESICKASCTFYDT